KSSTQRRKGQRKTQRKTKRPFLLYHWSPASRRKAIERRGLVPGSTSRCGRWRPPYVCFCRYPNTAWALSATHSKVRGVWDLWCVWSDVAQPYTTLNTATNARAWWWMTEYRCARRIPKSQVWWVGSRRFVPRRKAL
ncbi:MAG: hypothetical protein NTY53_24105, partial [Kiritimatiellaeota bacterium]|nr:hypothetical protein [Kiritimatiellota bacterium]